MKKQASHFLHNYMPLELLARSLFGDKYVGSVDWTRASDWKQFYLRTLKLIRASVFTSLGSIDESHRENIKSSLDGTIEKLEAERSKDRIHAVLIVGLFSLVFLLLGRRPYVARGPKRDFSTFRTLTYSQSEEQLSWLLQGHIQRNASELGFEDSFDADMAFFHWSKENGYRHSDRSGYVEWVRDKYPSVLSRFK